MNLILRSMGDWGVYYCVRYCVELTDGTIGKLSLVDNDAATVKFLKPYLASVPIPGGLRLPPMMAFGPPMSEPIKPPPTTEERRKAMLARRGIKE
jgi:hypothetical protein